LSISKAARFATVFINWMLGSGLDAGAGGMGNDRSEAHVWMTVARLCSLVIW
jgi:hypothetical protein